MARRGARAVTRVRDRRPGPLAGASTGRPATRKRPPRPRCVYSHSIRCRSPIHRVLMRPYTALGRRPDALRQYHLCVTSLRRDLGVDPEVETKELYQTILRYRATARTTGVTVVDVAPDGELRWQSVDDVALIGRTSERALLVKAMDAAWAGRSGGVALLGEAGIGKSRLVSELIGEARRRGG